MCFVIIFCSAFYGGAPVEILCLDVVQQACLKAKEFFKVCLAFLYFVNEP